MNVEESIVVEASDTVDNVVFAAVGVVQYSTGSSTLQPLQDPSVVLSVDRVESSLLLDVDFEFLNRNALHVIHPNYAGALKFLDTAPPETCRWACQH